MDDWAYCQETLPKVSRTFALNICVLEGELKRSVLVAYLFCRIVDTVEDAAQLDARIKIRLLNEFAAIIQDPDRRAGSLETWVQDCRQVDGSPADLDLLANTPRVFRVFDTLPANHRDQVIPAVAEMARGMAGFQGKFEAGGLTLLETEEELEDYCYFVAGLVGEMLCNLFLQELPGLSPQARDTMRRHAVSFGLGLQMTNIGKDMVVDRERGWSYIPRSYITESGLTVEAFQEGRDPAKNLEVLERLLRKTLGHLQDALTYTLAIPSSAPAIRLFCIWPLWMALETVAVLNGNRQLLQSDAPVKISRDTVKRILRRTRWICRWDFLLKWSFSRIEKRSRLKPGARFNLQALKDRLKGEHPAPSPTRSSLAG